MNYLTTAIVGVCLTTTTEATETYVMNYKLLFSTSGGIVTRNQVEAAAKTALTALEIDGSQVLSGVSSFSFLVCMPGW